MTKSMHLYLFVFMFVSISLGKKIVEGNKNSEQIFEQTTTDNLNEQQYLNRNSNSKFRLIPPLTKPLSPQFQKVYDNIEYTHLGIPKIVWVYWREPRMEVDHYMNSFSANRKAMLKGWQIVELNETTALEWIQQDPQYGDALERVEFKTDGEAKRADVVRFVLIKYFGGVWVDYTIILLENFDWIENLDKVELIDYRFGDAPDLFLIYSSEHGEMQRAVNPSTNMSFLLFPSF